MNILLRGFTRHPCFQKIGHVFVVGVPPNPSPHPSSSRGPRILPELSTGSLISGVEGAGSIIGVLGAGCPALFKFGVEGEGAPMSSSTASSNRAPSSSFFSNSFAISLSNLSLATITLGSSASVKRSSILSRHWRVWDMPFVERPLFIYIHRLQLEV